MYSIFNTKSRKLPYLEEGEPPPKRIVTEGDVLIKKLAQNQLKTDISLVEHLSRKKEFAASETFTDVSAYIGGKRDLRDFETGVANMNQINKLKSKGLSNNDINIYRDYIKLGPEFWLKHKEVNRDALQRRVHEILHIVNSTDHSDIANEWESTAVSRHEEEYLNSLKSQSVEMKLLKFATENKPKTTQFASPMDELPDVEQQIMQDIEEFSECDLKKIRKKARSLGNKVENLIKSEVVSSSDVKTNKLLRKTQWDVKNKLTNITVEKTEIRREEDKVYTCKPQTLYTIDDGKIIKLNKDRTIPEIINTEEKSKLTVEEIKNMPKFANYEAGSPSRVLFLKNLRNKVTKDFLKTLLVNFLPESYVIKIMKGKMKGQAFVEFQDVTRANEALEVLRGVLVDGQPIIAQFGTKT